MQKLNLKYSDEFAEEAGENPVACEDRDCSDRQTRQGHQQVWHCQAADEYGTNW